MGIGRWLQIKHSVAFSERSVGGDDNADIGEEVGVSEGSVVSLVGPCSCVYTGTEAIACSLCLVFYSVFCM